MSTFAKTFDDHSIHIKLLKSFDAKTAKTMDTVSLLQVPVNLGQPFLGPDRSPNVLLENGLLQLLGSCGWRVSQVPETITRHVHASSPSQITIERDLNVKNCTQIGMICEKIYHQVLEQAETNNFVLILGGDHCIPIGTIPALLAARPNTGVVWVDAHADINTPMSSASGNMHGMPLSFLLGLVEDAKLYPSLSWFDPPYLRPSDIVYIGLRDLDPQERIFIRKFGIKAFTMNDVDHLGIGRVMEQCLSHFEDKSNIHLSFDIDALDPSVAPHTGTSVRGGLTFRESNYVCEALASSNKLTSMELVEVNPSLHPTVDPKQTIDMAMALLGSAMGQRIL